METISWYSRWLLCFKWTFWIQLQCILWVILLEALNYSIPVGMNCLPVFTVLNLERSKVCVTIPYNHFLLLLFYILKQKLICGQAGKHYLNHSTGRLRITWLPTSVLLEPTCTNYLSCAKGKCCICTFVFPWFSGCLILLMQKLK